MKITVQKLDRPYHDGDWHDPLLRWVVIGPGNEEQVFHTRKNAMHYKRCRKQSTSMPEASFLYRNS